jgi:hypothetical protein
MALTTDYDPEPDGCFTFLALVAFFSLAYWIG